jgi:hypothetical protein
MDWLFRYADPELDWGYALITLIVRFIGVFVVMLAMQVALQVAARAVGVIERRRRVADGARASVLPVAPVMPQEPTVDDDDATVAAIGLALALESGQGEGGAQGGPSAWGIAGRMAQMNRLPPRRR